MIPVYRGRRLEGRKQCCEGIHRGATPETTFARLRPHFDHLNLTRISNITGLDRIGIPVTLAIRPNSPDIGTNSGKGLTIEAANASAAMEAFEHHCGEHPEVECTVDSYESLRRSVAMIPLDRLALSKYSLFHTALPERWCFGWDLLSAEETATPYDLVGVHYPSKFSPSSMSSFQSGTNGLAAGNSLAEAVTSALMEVVERDSRACHFHAENASGRFAPLLRLEGISSPAVTELIERLDSADTELYIFDITTDLQIPTFEAVIFDRRTRESLVGRGWGAHLDVETALLRAITEAAQVRLVHIAGIREEAFRRYYEMWKTQDCSAFRRDCAATKAYRSADEINSIRNETFEADIGVVLERLVRAGIEQVIVFDLTPRGIDLAAVRVIVPGLEGYLYEFYMPGKRAAGFGAIV